MNGHTDFMNLPHSRRPIPIAPITTPDVGVNRFNTPLANENDAILPDAAAVEIDAPVGPHIGKIAAANPDVEGITNDNGKKIRNETITNADVFMLPTELTNPFTIKSLICDVSSDQPIPAATAITKQTPSKSRAPAMASSTYFASPSQLMHAMMNPEIRKNTATSGK